MVKYPTRCKIIDVSGEEFMGMSLKTPEKSKPHIGKEGTAYKEDGTVHIELDDGSFIYGYECWWEQIEEEE